VEPVRSDVRRGDSQAALSPSIILERALAPGWGVRENQYLEEITGQPFTAKDFRTWAGTLLAALALGACESFETQAAAKRNVTRAIEQVAAQLGNTVAVRRKSYIHPEVVEAYLDGTLLRHLDEATTEVLLEELAGLREEEVAVLALLQQRPSREPPPTGRKLEAARRRSIEKEHTVQPAAAPPAWSGMARMSWPQNPAAAKKHALRPAA
jgi:Eukaryotic DNA topoisomerase I, catalytic core